METHGEIGRYLEFKRRQRREVFDDAASTSLLMHGVTFLCRHFYHLLDAYAWLFLRLATRRSQESALGKRYADAVDTYFTLWVGVAFLCYWAGWQIVQSKDELQNEWLYWILPVAICGYHIFESYAALIEMYFRESESRHHQFRILIHAFLHYLAIGFSFALFYLLTDRCFQTFTSENDDGNMESVFKAAFDPIYHSMVTIVAFSPNDEPQNWIGKLLILIELFFGFMLATFIFLNITQIWAPNRPAKT